MSQDKPHSALASRERRTILQAGALGAALLVLPGFNTRSAALAGKPSAAAFIEDRHAEVAGFLRLTREFTASIVSVGADPWEAVAKLTAFDPGATPLIFGLTGTGALTVLSQLALERGYNLAYRGVHRPLQAGVVEHRLQGQSEWTDSIATALLRSRAWMLDLAAALGRPSLSSGSGIARRTVMKTIGAGEGDDSRTWNSWVLSGRKPRI